MILDEIVAVRRRELDARDPRADQEKADRVARQMPPVRSLEVALRSGPTQPSVIAEFKRRSPSAGPIRPGANPTEIAAEYAAAGAAALSILTNREFFDGDLAHLALARAGAPGVPLLRKDFLIDPRDVVDARLAGADAILLIVRLLDDATLSALLRQARGLGMDVLVEVHDEREWDRALAAGSTIVGVNHRDLDTLAMNLELSARLAKVRPPGVTLVAESGLRSRDDLVRMRDRGFDAVLVGEALMKSPSPGAALASLVDGLGRTR